MKNLKKLLFVILLFVSANLLAQEYRPIKNVDTNNVTRTNFDQEYYNYDTVKYSNLFDYSVGLRYSNISGYGISLSSRFLEYFSATFSSFIIFSDYVKWSDMSKTQEIENSKDNLYDFGLELRANIFTSNKTNIYVLFGGYLSEAKQQDNIDNLNYMTNYTAGVGFGLDWYWSKKVSADFNCGYKFDYIKEEKTENYPTKVTKPSLTQKTNVGIGIGISYHF